MTQKALTAELLSMRKQAERIAQNIDQISRNLFAKRQSLLRVVKEYGEKRVKLIVQELHSREMTWCTYCFAVIPENEADLLLIKGREEYSCGYENSCYGFRDFFRLHRACSKCREQAFDRHGILGNYDTIMKDQTSFYAFHAERREDGHYARKFGNWVKLDDKNCTLDEPSSQLIEKLAEEWNLPPRIEVESKWPSSAGELIVHERVAMAEAS